MNFIRSSVLVGAAVVLVVLLLPNIYSHIFVIGAVTPDPTVYQAELVRVINASDLPPIGDESNFTGLIRFLPLDTDASKVAYNQSAVTTQNSLRKGPPIQAVSSNTPRSLPGGFDGLLELQIEPPPDPQVAVSTDYIMEHVNSNGEIWTKHGAVQRNNFTLYSFYGISSSHLVVDPKLFYDVVSNRWFASILDATNNTVWLAVSYTDDPTYLWAIYSFSTGSACADQPRTGASDNKFAIVITSYVSGCSGNPLFDKYFIVDKNGLLAHSQSVLSNVYTTSANIGLVPARSLSSSSNLYMVSIPFVGGSTVHYYTVSNTVPLPPGSITNQTISITTASTVSPPLQPGSQYVTVKIDDRMLDAVWKNGKLWFTLNDECIPGGDAQFRNCFRLTQIDTTTTTKTQDFDVGSAGNYYYYPALSMDSLGGLAVVFGFSDATSTYPSLGITGQSIFDISGDWDIPVTIKAGSHLSTSGRYGDYFGASRDESNETKIWVVGEYNTKSNGLASTFISPMQIDDYYPVADAGPTQTVNGGAVVTLDGSLSSDPDGDPITYSWTQYSGIPVTLSNANTAHPTFTAPFYNPSTTLRFQLIVNDGTRNSDPSFVNIVVSQSCVPPTSGDWTISSSCTLPVSSTAPAHVIVQPSVKLTIPPGLSLNIDFIHYHLLVKSGGGVLIQVGGKIT